MKKNVLSFITLLIIALAVVLTPVFTYNTPFTGVLIEVVLLMLLAFIPDVKIKRGK